MGWRRGGLRGEKSSRVGYWLATAGNRDRSHPRTVVFNLCERGLLRRNIKLPHNQASPAENITNRFGCSVGPEENVLAQNSLCRKWA